MTGSIFALAVIAAAAVLFWRIGSGAPALGNRLRHPKGWLSPASLDDALDVADRHLPHARAGAGIRLQYGSVGCLTLLRAKPGDRSSGFLARWEFWRPDRALAQRMIDHGATRVDTPQADVLELAGRDDYPSFRKAVDAVFSERPTEGLNMHLTWNC